MATILITGASSGIGAALAKQYADNGYQVFACGRNIQRLEKLAQHSSNITTLICDVTDKQQIAHVQTELPALDILLLNAGDCEYIDDPLNFDGDLFARVITTNLISVGYCLESWLRLVKEGGQLALTSSSAAFLPLPRAEAYGASKAAMTYLGKTLHIDLKPQKIAVSVIHPGFVETPLTAKNTFAMPNIITSEQAALHIVKGLNKRRTEINFPCGFILIMKLLAILPFTLWLKIASKLQQ